MKKSYISRAALSTMIIATTMFSPVTGVATYYADVPFVIEAEAATVSYYPRYTGKSSSIVDILKSYGADSSFSARKKLYNLQGLNMGTYTGSAKQNTALVQRAKAGSLIRSKGSANTSSVKTSAPKVVLQGSYTSISYGYSNTAKTKKATIASSGCGPVSLINAVLDLTGKTIPIKELAKYSVDNGFRVDGVGTAHGLFKSYINAYGGRYGVKYGGSASGYKELSKALSNGKTVAICSKPGHFMAITRYDATKKKFLLIDSQPSKARKTQGGYRWATESELQSMGLRTTFYLIKKN